MTLTNLPLLDIWNKLFLSNFLNTLPLISTNCVWERTEAKKKEMQLAGVIIQKIQTIMLQLHLIINMLSLIFLGHMKTNNLSKIWFESMRIYFICAWLKLLKLSHQAACCVLYRHIHVPICMCTVSVYIVYVYWRCWTSWWWARTCCGSWRRHWGWRLGPWWGWHGGLRDRHSGKQPTLKSKLPLNTAPIKPITRNVT